MQDFELGVGAHMAGQRQARCHADYPHQWAPGKGDESDGGFPSDVLLALYELSNTYDTLYPKLARKKTSVVNNA